MQVNKYAELMSVINYNVKNPQGVEVYEYNKLPEVEVDEIPIKKVKPYSNNPQKKVNNKPF